MNPSLVLAIDGGNSKTDVALVRADGELLGATRGGGSSPHQIGTDGCVELLDALLAEVLEQAGLARDGRPIAEIAHVHLAGADLPAEELELERAVASRGWAARAIVANDTFAVLRAGTDAGWGVAIVCGAGINCVGVAPDGRHSRFPALGAITGDWGGGYDVGMAGLWAAARSADGRGSKTSLEQAVPRHLGLDTPNDVAEAIHRGRFATTRVVELAPLVFAAAEDGDDVAQSILARLAEELVTLARVALQRLDLTDEAVDVVLGGGLLRSDHGPLLAAVEEGIHAVAPAATVRVTTAAPIVGAALLGLDELGAGAAAQERLRRELAAALAGSAPTTVEGAVGANG